jgi:hypothetical protein
MVYTQNRLSGGGVPNRFDARHIDVDEVEVDRLIFSDGSVLTNAVGPTLAGAPSTMVTQSAIGSISAGTSVQQLRQQYPNGDADLLRGILELQPFVQRVPIGTVHKGSSPSTATSVGTTVFEDTTEVTVDDVLCAPLPRDLSDGDQLTESVLIPRPTGMRLSNVYQLSDFGPIPLATQEYVVTSTTRDGVDHVHWYGTKPLSAWTEGVSFRFELVSV